MNRVAAELTYRELIQDAQRHHKEWETMRALALGDLYYLLMHILNDPFEGYMAGISEAEKDWIHARCMEVQASPNGHLDLWAREHYKSTIITYARTIQDNMSNPEDTFGIFSHVRPIAKGFLKQIKREYESNEKLRWLFPDRIWDKPAKDAPKWSEDDGIILKRKGNPRESTIEAWGLVDGQPISRHFTYLIYDDVISPKGVTNLEMIKKVTDSWALSLNLGTQHGHKRYIGTRYHLADTYAEMMKRGAASPRVYPATKNGKAEGEPWFLTQNKLAEKRREMGSFIFACQMLQAPKEDAVISLSRDDLRFWPAKQFTSMNVYILVDPASKKHKKSDYTSMMAIGTAEDRNYYVIKMIRDRLNLKQRTASLMALHRFFNDMGMKVLTVGYEEYGLQADIEHIQEVMDRENYRFDITPLGGGIAKDDRIAGALIPLSQEHRIWLPDHSPHVNYQGVQEDLTMVFIDEEWVNWPLAIHDDMLDNLARIKDPAMGIAFPNKRAIHRTQTHAVSDD